jgi:hypothetical protein
VDLSKKLVNSLFWSIGNLILVTATFSSFSTRFSGLGISLVKVVFAVLAVTAALSIRDICSTQTRGRGFLALLLCVPILMFFGILTVWEGPLQVHATGTEPIKFKIDGPAGFHGFSVYSSEHGNAEWLGDEIGLVWSFGWQKRSFPPMQIQFAYGALPSGYSQVIPASDTVPPRLDPEAAYRIVVSPGMGTPEYFTLRGSSLTKSNNEFGDDVCWGQLNVAGQNNPASVRVNCGTRQFLPMSPRAQDRLKAYREKRIFSY